MIYKIKQYILANKEKFNLDTDQISFIQLNSNPHKSPDYAKIIVIWFKFGQKTPFLISKIAKNTQSATVIEFENNIKKIFTSKCANIPITIDCTTINNHYVCFEKAVPGISWQKIIEKSDSKQIKTITKQLFSDWEILFSNTQLDEESSKSSPYHFVATKEMQILESRHQILQTKNMYNCDLIAQNIFQDKENNYIIDWELVTVANKLVPVLRFFHNYLQQIFAVEKILPADSLQKFREFMFNREYWFHKMCKNLLFKIIGFEISDEEWVDYWKYLYLWELQLQKKISYSSSANHVADLENRLAIINEDIYTKDLQIIKLETKLKNLTDRESENAILKSRLHELESSTFWKITKPLRTGTDFLKQTTVSTRINTKQQLQKLSPYLPSSLKNTIRPFYHKIFSGIPNNQSPQITLDKVDPNLINETFERDTMLDIFVFPVIDWHGRWQRPQQIISRLAKRGHRIFYFSPTFHQTNNQDLLKSIKISDKCDNIYQIQLPLLVNLNIYQDTLSENHIKILLSAINIIKDKFAINHLVSIIHQPFWFPLVQKINRNKIVYDCMDEHSGFTTNSIHQQQLEQKLCQSADLVITSSENLYQKASKTNQNVIIIRNGSDIDHFYELPICHESMIKKPIIGYYGAISDWFDIELIASAARYYPDYSFVLIGHTYGADTSNLEKLPNIYLLGEKNYQELPEYLACFDVCLIPFKINSLTLATNPVKFYEYISSGKPVVSTALPELTPHQDICYIAKDHNEFIDYIKTALDESDKSIISKRKAVAMANSWQSRVGDYEKNIFSLFPSVSIIVISYNNPDITRNCLESIYKYSRYPNFEVIVVDNASTEDTLNYLHSIEQHFPHLHIIYNRENAGFAKANNQGIKLAHGDYIIFLNNDTIVTNNWIASLVTHMESDSQIGLLGPVTNNIGNEQKIPVDYQDINSMQQFAYEYTAAHHHQLQPIKMLALFCAIARLSDLRQVDYLSEEYDVGMFEDDDLSQKFKAIGKKIIMADDVFIHHIGRASFSKLADQTYQTIFNRNRATYEKKWGPWVPHQPRKK